MTGTAAIMAGEDVEVRQRAAFRYGAVFLLMVALLVFVIVAPAGDATRAVVLAALVVAGVAIGALPLPLVLATNGILTAVVLLTLVGGLLRLVRMHGVTLQVVAGALTIYVLTGLIFAWVVSLVANVGQELVASRTAGDAKQKIDTALQGLASSYDKALAPIDC
jgi:hypothetical protein